MRFKPVKREESRFDLTPLVDVVFLLLIFFMLSTTFIVAPGIKVKLPRSSSTEISREKKEVRVVMAKDDKIFVEQKLVTIEELGKYLKKAARESKEGRGSTLVFVKFRKVETVPDVLWGQLYKSQRSIHRALQKHKFNVIRNIVWSDEENLNVFIFEIEERFLPLMKKHLGPPIGKRAECERFLRKHLDAPHTISGPRVEEGRWVVEMKRKHRDVVNLLNDMLRDGGRHVGVADLISQVFSEGFEILVNEEILETCTSNLHFSKFLMEYLKGKPRWLQ